MSYLFFKTSVLLAKQIISSTERNLKSLESKKTIVSVILGTLENTLGYTFSKP